MRGEKPLPSFSSFPAEPEKSLHTFQLIAFPFSPKSHRSWPVPHLSLPGKQPGCSIPIPGEQPLLRFSFCCLSLNKKQHHDCLSGQPSHQRSCSLSGQAPLILLPGRGGTNVTEQPHWISLDLRISSLPHHFPSQLSSSSPQGIEQRFCI